MDGKSYTLFELASLVGGEVVGDPDLVISGLCDIAEAEAGHLAFLTKAGRSQEIDETSASAVIVPLAVKQAGKTLLRVKDPNLAAAVIHQHFLRRPFAATGLHASAVVGADCKLPSEFSIGPQAVLGDRVTLGERVMVHAGVIIGNDVTIGADTILYPNVTVYDNSRIGARVIVHSGTVIGSDGFGYATDDKGRHLKRPHVGIVQIDDEVELGANVCIDRGTFGRTWIQQGAKIDNLVQIGHNVVVGAGCLIVSQVGIAGSATLGRGVILGGQAGIKGHIHLDDGVMVASKSGVHGSLSKGAVVAGYPAVPHREWLKTSALVGKLPQLHQELRDMKKAVAALREKLAGVDTTTP